MTEDEQFTLTLLQQRAETDLINLTTIVMPIDYLKSDYKPACQQAVNQL